MNQEKNYSTNNKESDYTNSETSVDNIDLQHKTNLRKILPLQSIIVIIFAMSAMIIPFCIDMYLSVIPQIADEFHVPSPKIEFTLSIFFIGIAVGQFIFGALSDSIGRRWIAIFGYLSIVISSIFIAQIHNLYVFYTLRLIQGIFAAAIIICQTAVLRDIYTTKDFVAINGTINLIFFLAPFIAPLLGSFIAHHYQWQSIFLFTSGISCIILVLYWYFIPETINPQFRKKFSLTNILVDYYNIVKHNESFWLIGLMSISSSMLFVFVTMSSVTYQTYFNVSERVFPYFFMLNIIGASFINILNTKLIRKYESYQLLKVGIIFLTIIAIWNIIVAFFHLNFAFYVIGCVLTMSISPLLFLNSMAIYLDIHYKQSGTATSLYNICRWALPAIITIIAQQLNPDAGYSMILIMGITALIITFCFVRYTSLRNKI